MFNPFLRSFLPGFRVGPDGVPGFNVDDNGLPRRAIPSLYDTLAGSEAQPSPDAAQTPSLPSISLHQPGIEDWDLSAPWPGFRVGPQADVPGFNFRPQNNTPGFNLDENSVPQQETTWSYGLPSGSLTPQDLDGPQTPTEEPAPAALPLLPKWLYQPGTMPPPLWPTAFDPRTRSHVEVNSQPGIVSATEPRVDQLPPSSAPQQAADIKIRSNAWLQPPKDGWPYAQEDGDRLPMPSITPLAASSFTLANVAEVGGRQPLQHVRSQQDQQTQGGMPLASLSTEPATAHRSAKQNIKMTEFNPKSGNEFSQLIEAYRQLKEAESKQASSAGPSLSPRLNSNEVSNASGSGGPSLGRRLLQSSVETLVPGAYYQELARQQFRTGNYVSAGVYQTAALADALLGVATLGLSTKLAAAGRTAAADGAALFRRAFDSSEQLLRYLGRAPEGMQWHHIVEQSQAAQFGQRRIQSVENIVAIPVEAHQKLNAFYSSKRYFSTPERVRVWLRRKSFEEQYQYGMERLRQVLGY